MIIGYTAGVYDLFHIGHLNILKHAKSLCDKLIVGVTTDELALSVKGELPRVKFNDRLSIVSSLKCVDVAISQIDYNKFDVCVKLNIDYVFCRG